MFVRSVFPERFPGLEPSFLFFDNACGLRAHVRSSGDISLLSRVALVVDPFHFSGHSASDTECQKFCNPSVFPILRTAEGGWLFNSSAAEQANAWFGKFQSKVKEMNVIRSVSVSCIYSSRESHLCIWYSYNFFLDEVLNIRNGIREKELARRGFGPRRMTEEELGSGDSSYASV